MTDKTPISDPELEPISQFRLTWNLRFALILLLTTVGGIACATSLKKATEESTSTPATAESSTPSPAPSSSPSPSARSSSSQRSQLIASLKNQTNPSQKAPQEPSPELSQEGVPGIPAPTSSPAIPPQLRLMPTPPNNLIHPPPLSPFFSRFLEAPGMISLPSRAADNSLPIRRDTPEHLAPSPSAPEVRSQSELIAPTGDVNEVVLSLTDVIFLALENNRTIKNQYLDRIVQREDLAVAEDKFLPNFTPTISLLGRRERDGDESQNTGGLDLGAELSIQLPTGAQVSVNWKVLTQGQTGSNSVFSGQNSLNNNISVQLRQPLLRGAGAEVNRASVKIARLVENLNLYQLKSILMGTLTDAILTYRRLIQAQEALKIAELSLRNAEEELKNFQILVDLGREAQVDIVRNETDVANRRFNVVSVANNLEQQRLALMEILDLEDYNLKIIPEAIPEIQPQKFDQAEMIALALKNRPDYLQAQINQEIESLNLLLAKDRERLQLDVQTSYNNIANTFSDNRGDFRAELRLSQDFGDRTIEQQIKSSQVNLAKAQNEIAEVQQTIAIEVENAVRDVNVSLEQVQLAQQARDFAERQLEIEKEKQRLGMPTTNIEIVRFQDALVEAQNQELNARIDYFNALTILQQTVGTTLDYWEIQVEDPERLQIEN